MIQSISSLKKKGTVAALLFQTVKMMWQYTTIGRTARADKALKKESDKGWHDLGPEASSRLDNTFQFALVDSTFFITFAPCLAYKMSVEKIYPTGMELINSTDKPGKRFLMRRGGDEMDEDADPCDFAITLMSGRAVLEGSFAWRTPWKGIKCKCEDMVKSTQDLNSRMDWRGLVFVKGTHMLTPEDLQRNLGYKIEEEKDKKAQKKVKTTNNPKKTKKTHQKKSAN